VPKAAGHVGQHSSFFAGSAIEGEGLTALIDEKQRAERFFYELHIPRMYVMTVGRRVRTLIFRLELRSKAPSRRSRRGGWIDHQFGDPCVIS
jgi:hypothetical protein